MKKSIFVSVILALVLGVAGEAWAPTGYPFPVIRCVDGWCYPVRYSEHGFAFGGTNENAPAWIGTNGNAYFTNLSAGAITPAPPAGAHALVAGQSDVSTLYVLTAGTQYGLYYSNSVYYLTTVSATGGVTEHSDLTGLLDDDHPQYITTAELIPANADASFIESTEFDHDGLLGLLDDDHPQYITTAEAGELDDLITIGENLAWNDTTNTLSSTASGTGGWVGTATSTLNMAGYAITNADYMSAKEYHSVGATYHAMAVPNPGNPSTAWAAANFFGRMPMWASTTDEVYRFYLTDGTTVANFYDDNAYPNMDTDYSDDYTSGGTDVPLLDGGTGASMTDPSVDRIMFWDYSDASMDWLIIGDNASIQGNSLNVDLGNWSTEPAIQPVNMAGYGITNLPYLNMSASDGSYGIRAINSTVRSDTTEGYIWYNETSEVVQYYADVADLQTLATQDWVNSLGIGSTADALYTIVADSGSLSADSPTTTISIVGGTAIGTTIVGKVITIHADISGVEARLDLDNIPGTLGSDQAEAAFVLASEFTAGNLSGTIGTDQVDGAVLVESDIEVSVQAYSANMDTNSTDDLVDSDLGVTVGQHYANADTDYTDDTPNDLDQIAGTLGTDQAASGFMLASEMTAFSASGLAAHVASQDAHWSESEMEAVLDLPDLQGIATSAQLDAAVVLTSEVPGLEATLEAVLDLPDMQGTATSDQLDTAVMLLSEMSSYSGSGLSAHAASQDAHWSESEMEAVLDLPDLQGVATSDQLDTAVMLASEMAPYLTTTAGNAAYANTMSHSVQWFTPADTDDDMFVWRAVTAGTVVEIEVWVDGDGDDSVTIDVLKGTDLMSDDLACGDESWTVDSTIANATYAIDDEITVDVVSVSGTPTKIFVNVSFKE